MAGAGQWTVEWELAEYNPPSPTATGAADGSKTTDPSKPAATPTEGHGAGAAEDVAYEKDPQMLLSPETKLIPDAIPRRIRRNARNAMRVNTFFYGACMRMKVRDGYEWDFMRFRLLNF